MWSAQNFWSPKSQNRVLTCLMASLGSIGPSLQVFQENTKKSFGTKVDFSRQNGWKNFVKFSRVWHMIFEKGQKKRHFFRTKFGTKIEEFARKPVKWLLWPKFGTHAGWNEKRRMSDRKISDQSPKILGRFWWSENREKKLARTSRNFDSDLIFRFFDPSLP